MEIAPIPQIAEITPVEVISANLGDRDLLGILKRFLSRTFLFPLSYPSPLFQSLPSDPATD